MKMIAQIIRPKNIIVFLIIVISLFRFYELQIPDIIEDEDGHIRDAIAYYHKDPFVVPRHHPFHHTIGNMAHPFFHHFLIYISYNLFGPSNASSRLPAAVMSIITALGVYYLAKKMFNEKAALFASSLYLVSPLVFRISRTANVDNTFAAFGCFTLYYFYKYLKERKLVYALFCSLLSAVLFSIRLVGIMIFVIFFIYLFALILYRSIKINRSDIIALILSLMVFLGFFILFNDPASYLDGIIHPADPSCGSVFTNPFGLDWVRLKGALTYLFPWHFTLLLIISLLLAIRNIFKKGQYYQDQLLLIINMVIFFSGFRFSLERGLIIFLIPACILTGKYLADIINFHKYKHQFLLLGFFILFIPYVIWYGFRTKPLPFPPYDFVTHNYNNRLKVFDYLNHLPQKNITVSVLPSTLFFPELNVRKGVELVPLVFKDMKTTDYFLTDKMNIYQEKLTDKNYQLILLYQYKEDLAALFKRIN